MANTISLDIDISVDDVGTLNDLTTYTDPIRADVGVFIQGYKVNSSSVETEVILTPDTDDPLTVAAWDFDITVDGWYQFKYVAVPEYDGGVTYAIYEAVWDSSTGLVYRSSTGSNLGNSVSNTDYWELIEDPGTLAENEELPTESTNIDSAIYNRILTPKVDRLYGDKAVLTAKECCGDCERPENVDIFELVFALREGALISEERQEFAEGEKDIRRLDEFVG